MNAALESRHARGQALTVLLGSLSTLVPFSNDSVLPVFRSMQSEFAVSDLEMQQVLSAILAGAISHQVSGSARSLALCSLAIFVCALACWLGYLARIAARLRSARP